VREGNELSSWPGAQFIIESVNSAGSFFHVTKYGQSDLALKVSGVDAFGVQD
jgi:hypothetical protein